MPALLQVFRIFFRHGARIGGRLAGLLVLLLLPGAAALGQSGVEVQRTPDEGLHPRLLQDSQGNVHLLYFRKRGTNPRGREGDLFYRQYDAAARDWGTPRKVSSQSFSYADPIYRANFAVDDDGRVHVVWFQSRPNEFFYTRSDPQRLEFEPRRSMVEQNLEGVDAGADIAARDGRVVITWAAGSLLQEESRTVFMRHSSDAGATFGAETRIGDPALGACACCSLAVEFERDGGVLVAYRSAIAGVGRHMQLLRVGSVTGADVTGSYGEPYDLQKWELTSCPVSTNDFARDYQGNNWLVFETQSRVVQLDTSGGNPPSLVAESLVRTRQKNPSIAFSSDDYKLVVWAEGISFTRGGILNWQLFDEQGNPVAAPAREEINIPDNSAPAAVITPAGSFLILY